VKTIILSAIIICAAQVSFAEEKAPAKSTEQSQEHLQMHEQMANAHQQAADCLKSGKSEEECQEAFHEMYKETGGPDKCGPWMMHHKMGKKTK
jgi:hypothetical protein